MARKPVRLANILAGAGTAMASANQRLVAAGAAALVRDASLTLSFNGRIECSGPELVLAMAQPSMQSLALAGRDQQVTNATLTIHLISAPALVPVAPS